MPAHSRSKNGVLSHAYVPGMTVNANTLLSRQRVRMCDALDPLRTYMRANAFTGITAMMKRPAFLLAFALAAAPFAAQAEPAVIIPPPPMAETLAQGAGL